jgi:hypothetical protein
MSWQNVNTAVNNVLNLIGLTRLPDKRGPTKRPVDFTLNPSDPDDLPLLSRRNA